MVRFKRFLHRLICPDTDPESQPEDPSLSGELPDSAVTESDEPNAHNTEIFVSRGSGQEDQVVNDEDDDDDDDDEDEEASKHENWRAWSFQAACPLPCLS